MKTCATDTTVLCKLRVSSFSPSPDNASSCPATSRKSQQKTTVYNGVSANSWLLPIGICERDITTENQSEKCHPNTRNSEVKSTKKEIKLICDETTDNAVENEVTDKHASEVCESEGQDGKDEVPDTAHSTKSSRHLTSEEFDSLWERVSQRPQHTGKIFIVRRKNVPEGIDKKEYLQGKHLRSKVEADEPADGETSIRLQPRPFTAPGKRKGGTRCSPSPRPFSHTGVRRVRDSFEKTPPYTGSVNLSLDLVITSLHFSPHESSRTAVHDRAFPHQDIAKTSGDGYSSRPKTASALTSKNRNHGDSLSTIDGIKRDYLRRAKSAPPNGRSKDISPNLCDRTTTGSRGPSLYWRARSAYHKKLMTYGSDEVPDPNEQTQSIRGSLWRPLIVGEEGSVMQHSAGCPYKCKGCFKACLVSEDYLEKARAQKALREREQIRQTGCPAPHGRPISVPHKYRVKLHNPKNLVSIALARSQPLYQIVHGTKPSKHEDLSPSKDKENEDSSGYNQDSQDKKIVDTSTQGLENNNGVIYQNGSTV
ncbi:hypothetical protein ACOMHN_050249 [Nucella lapillus]